jgi:DHA1 family bicyclomycin/chloramphenicol resistance-like MFS transporter
VPNIEIEQKTFLQRVVWLFPLVAAAPLGLDICLPGTTIISDAFSSSSSLTQWLISGYVLCLSLGQLFFGPLVDRYGSQRIFVIGCVLYLTGAGLVYFAANMSWLIGFRFLQGIGASAAAVAVFSSVPRAFAGLQIGKAFALLNSVISLVPVLAPIVGGLLIVRWGWQASFYFIVGYVLLCLLVVAVKPLPAVQGDGPFQTSDIIAGYRRVWQNSGFQLGCVASGCGFASQLIFFSSSPLVIIDFLHIPVTEFGYYFAVNALGITCGSLAVTKLLSRYKETQIMSVAAMLLLLAAAGFIIGQLQAELTVWAYLLPATLGSIAFAMLMSAGAALALAPFKQLAGSASALMACIQMTAASLVAWLVISFWTSQWQAMIGSYFVLAIIILLSLQRYQRQQNYTRSNTADIES